MSIGAPSSIGKYTILGELGPGDCFGEMLYFSTESALRSTTIRSTTPVLVLE